MIVINGQKLMYIPKTNFDMSALCDVFQNGDPVQIFNVEIDYTDIERRVLALCGVTPDMMVVQNPVETLDVLCNNIQEGRKEFEQIYNGILEKRVETGFPTIDKILEGGIVDGRIYAIIGPRRKADVGVLSKLPRPTKGEVLTNIFIPIDEDQACDCLNDSVGYTGFHGVAYAATACSALGYKLINEHSEVWDTKTPTSERIKMERTKNESFFFDRKKPHHCWLSGWICDDKVREK